ncbi:MAG: IS110 family transposase [Candidatus Nitrotoga sp.]|nr:IS110 family transposase [Candidatus Nitrotoga sp.]
MYPLSIRVAVDVGSTCHRVAVGLPDGKLLDEFDISHNAGGFKEFFHHIESLEKRHQLPVAVAMEGYNGWARPLDGQILQHGYRLYSVNNLKLARYKEIFPAPAKTDAIDARRILELFRLSEHLPLAKNALHEVAPTPVENDQLKRTTRRRKQLVWERVRVINRLQSDLHAVCPGLMAITGEADNIWFLNFLTCRDKLTKLANLRRSSLLAIPGVGKTYAAQIQAWQAQAQFATDAEWVGEMILQDAHRILALGKDIKALDLKIAGIAVQLKLAQTIGSIPGFGKTSMAEIAGEVGTLERFKSETGLAMYMGMSALDNSSGKKNGVKTPRHVNTRAKAAMMVAVARHIAYVPMSRAYYDKKRAEGKQHNQAIRALGRHLVRVIWSMVKQGRKYEVR